MNQKTPPQRSLDRKKREAVALKANMKRRKEQAKIQNEVETQQDWGNGEKSDRNQGHDS
jgi:hypothetical protein